MRVMVAAFTFVGLVGCNSTENRMVELVRSEMKDPKSAEFSHLELKQTTDGSIYVLCGMVNAKNSFGGYVGEKPFTATKLKDLDAVVATYNDEADCAKALAVAEEVAKGKNKG